jgi:ribosome-binding factor A
MQRVNNLIRRELSEILYKDVKDPRLGNFVSVNAVDVTPDLSLARVYVSFFGSDGEKQDALAALQQASGFFHGELLKHLKLRRVPELNFQWDDSIERGARILELIDQVNHDDAAG